MTSVLVVGGGVTGVTTAHRLAKRGCTVTLLEAGGDVGEGACYANGAMLTASQPDPWSRPGVLWTLLRSFADPKSAVKLRANALLPLAGWGWRFLRNATPERYAEATTRILALAQYSMEVYQSYVEEHGEAFDAVRSGTMKTFRSQEAFDAHCAQSTRLATFGLGYEVLDRPGMVEKEPQLAAIADDLVGAIYFPTDIVGDANKFCQLLARDLVEMGCEIRTDCRVRTLIEDDGTIKGVETESGALLAEHTVLTLGADPDGLARRAGVNLGIRPVKGYSVTFDTSELNAVPAIPVLDDSLHIGVIPIGKRLRIAGSVDFAGFDRSIPPGRIAVLEGIFNRVYPDLAPALIRRGGQPWAGLRPMSTDGLPYIGKTQKSGLWVNAGQGHLGWTLAAGSAEVLTDLLLGKEPAIDPQHLALER